MTRATKVAVARFVKLQWEPIQRSYVLLYPEGMVRLNTSAAEILKRCDGATSVGQIITELEETFYDSEAVELAVKQFVVVGLERGWVEVRHE